MTGNEVVTDVRSEFIEPSATFVSQARMLSLINLAQSEYVRKARVLQAFAYTSSKEGQSDYPMPPDWLGSEKVFFNATTDGTTPNWRPLEATNLEKMGQEYPNFLSSSDTTFGPPRRYYVIGSTLYIWPKPASDGLNDIFLFYESKPTPLTTLADTLSIDDSLYPGVRAYLLSKLWRMDNEDAKADREMQTFKEEIGEGRKWKNKRILDGKWKMDIQSYVPYGYTGGSSGTTAGSPNPLNM